MVKALARPRPSHKAVGGGMEKKKKRERKPDCAGGVCVVNLCVST